MSASNNWKPFPIAGGSYKDDTVPWSAQDTVNWLPVVAETQGTRTPIMLRGVPGLNARALPGTVFSAVNLDGTSKRGVAIRGAYNADGVFVILQGNTLYRYTGDFSRPTKLGTVPGVGRVAITHNQTTGGSQIFIANGTAGYVYDTVADTFAQISDDGFPGAKSADYIDSYIVAVEPQGRFWFASALADATSYNTLDRYEAESAPDKIVGLIVSHSEVIVFGERTMEFYYDSGANTNTFQRRDGTQTEVGAATQFGIVKLDNTVYWIGNDGAIYRLDGYNPVRISTQPIEQAISRCNLDNCFALVYADRGHKIVYFTFPDGQTWGYDVATQLWHRRQSYGMKRWRVNALTNWNGKWYAGDYTNGSLCSVEWGVNTENGKPLVAERVPTVIQAELNRFVLHGVELSINSQKSAPSYTFPLSITGALPDGFSGVTVDYQYQVSVSALPATVSISSGALPTGLSIDNNGKVTGTAGAGTFTWTVTVTDNDGNTAHVDDSATFTEVMPAQQTWSYLQVADSVDTDYSAADFDDSAWSTGSAPFGQWYNGDTSLAGAHTYDSRFTATFATTWDVETRLWMRRTLTLTSVPKDGIKVTYYMDDHFSFYVNGVDIYDSTPNPTQGAGGTFTITNSHLVVGDNSIAVFCHDEEPGEDGSVTYADFIIESTDSDTLTNPVEAAATPALVAAEPTDDLCVDLGYSKDGGQTWSDWRQQKLGLQGAFNKKVRFRRLGFGERITLRVRISADRGRDLVACSVDTEAF